VGRGGRRPGTTSTDEKRPEEAELRLGNLCEKRDREREKKRLLEARKTATGKTDNSWTLVRKLEETVKELKEKGGSSPGRLSLGGGYKGTKVPRLLLQRGSERKFEA